MTCQREELSGEINKRICERNLVSEISVCGTRFFVVLRKRRQNDPDMVYDRYEKRIRLEIIACMI